MNSCVHNYFITSIQKCPWCFGQDEHNKDAVPINGLGNGWLLRRGDTPCKYCGGPAGAGYYGVLAAETKQRKEEIATCYGCSTKGLR